VPSDVLYSATTCVVYSIHGLVALLGSEVVRVARQDRVAHISKQSSEPFRSYWKCRSQIESVLVLSISFG
jgi:hypothetical protein